MDGTINMGGLVSPGQLESLGGLGSMNTQAIMGRPSKYGNPRTKERPGNLRTTNKDVSSLNVGSLLSKHNIHRKHGRPGNQKSLRW